MLLALFNSILNSFCSFSFVDCDVWPLLPLSTVGGLLPLLLDCERSAVLHHFLLAVYVRTTAANPDHFPWRAWYEDFGQQQLFRSISFFSFFFLYPL
jgi:hypothetical protein